MPNDVDEKPLVIKDIREVLIPAMEEVFATKQDIADFRKEFWKEVQEKFDKIMNSQDKILKGIRSLMR